LTIGAKGGRIPKVVAKLPVVDKEKCIGCGTCVALAPKTFKLDGEGKAEVIGSPRDDEKAIKEAVESCAVDAITFKD